MLYGKSQLNRNCQIIVAAVIIGGVVGFVDFAAFASEPSGEGRVIEFGWDTPTIPWLCDNAAIVECTIAFDGIILDLARRESQAGLSWLAWAASPIPFDLQQKAEEDIELLNDANFIRLRENSFFRLNSSGWSSPPDWFDSDFNTVVSNITFMASAVNQTALAGIAFDPEDYFSNCWHYPSQKYSATKTFGQYQVQVRQRGREVAAAIKTACPGRDFTLLFTFANSLPYISTQWWGHPLSEDSYGLLPAFIDGLLDEACGQIRVIDGIESAYPNKTLAEFQGSISNYEGGATLSADPSRYLSCVGIGFGTWMDYRSNTLGWYTNPNEFNLNHFTPETFNQAMDISTDLAELSWVYTEIPDWYLGTVPEAYFDALADVTGLPPTTPCTELWAHLLRAKEPLPVDAAQNIHPEVVLSWEAGIKAASHDVYLGTDADAVGDANTSETLDVYMGRQDACEYEPTPPLELGRTYYWRVDEVNDPNIWKGWPWSFTVDDGKASGPDPNDGAPDIPHDAILSWSPGLVAASHDVYLGTDYDAVNDANTFSWEFKGNQNVDVNSYDPCGFLELGATYYWRIDEVNDPYNTAKGQVWSFRVNDGKARDPNPANDTWSVSTNIILSWTPGVLAASHDVYFGTNFDSVNDANTTLTLDVYMGTQNLDANTYNVSGLEPDQTYYWRIDEVNDGNIRKGDVWSFVVAEYIVIDDMESYTPGSGSPHPISDEWISGAVNETGSSLDVGTAPGDPVHQGQQSMKYTYYNSFNFGAGYYSETEREPPGPCDWTTYGIRALMLYFYGDPNNAADYTEQMYVALKDGDGNYAEVRYGDGEDEDMNDIKIAQWQEWNINLQDFNNGGVDLTDVNTVYIGFGDRYNWLIAGGTGTVYFDDIRLYVSRCVPKYGPTADFSGDCVVSFKDYAILGSQWLQPPDTPSADIAPEPLDGFVDWLDLDTLADSWLAEQVWPPEE